MRGTSSQESWIVLRPRYRHMSCCNNTEMPWVSGDHCYSLHHSCRTVNPQEHNLPAVLLQDIKRLIFGQNTGFLDVQSVSSKAIFMISTNIGVERAFQRTILQSDLQPSHGFNFIAILFRMQKAGKVAHPLTHCILFVSAAPDWHSQQHLSKTFGEFLLKKVILPWFSCLIIRE